MFDPKEIEVINIAAKNEGVLQDNAGTFITDSGIPVKPLYTPGDISETSYLRDLGFPGCPPYTRGVYREMYRKQLWTFRQVCGYGTAEETNERLRFLNQSGQTGLNIVPDTPTIYGRDSDDPLSEGEVGREGVAIDSLEDMRDLWRDIPLEKVSTSIIYNYPILFCMYLAVAEERGIPFSSLAGTLQNDPFTIIAGAKSWITTPAGSLKLCVDVIEFCARHLPRFNPVSVVGYHYREAGCTAAQEVGFTMSAGLAYAKAGVERGLNVDEFAPRISFFYNAHNDFFEEIAKMRAARRLWYRLMTERFHPANPRSTALRFHTQTAGSSLTAQQPLNNIIRTTIQAMAAILGGTQSLHTNSYDEALGLPSQEAVKIALRTQQIIANESNITRTVDPLAGSFFVETLTQEIEAKAKEIIQKIDSLGGMLTAVEKNFVQQAITESALQKQQRIDSGQDKVIGVNDFIEPDEKLTIEIMRVPPELEHKQIERLNATRRKRDSNKTRRALEKLEEEARQGKNTIKATIEAVKALATVGEIGQLYRKVFGTYTDPGL
ncbi:MAG: methylmalonyl-CoA mutase [Deltaproteobacteria bacterium]|nr:methylmalonyl-CoA mutase [Deltaproteobacteria bacterium]